MHDGRLEALYGWRLLYFKIKTLTAVAASGASGRKWAVRTRTIMLPPQMAIPRQTPPSGAEGRTRADGESTSGAAQANPGATRGAGRLAR